MEFDLTTFAIEVLNFLVLVWLLKRFFYRPVLTALEKRQAETAEIISKAEVMQHEAEVLKSEYQMRLSKVDQERAAAKARRLAGCRKPCPDACFHKPFAGSHRVGRKGDRRRPPFGSNRRGQTNRRLVAPISDAASWWRGRRSPAAIRQIAARWSPAINLQSVTRYHTIDDNRL